MSISPISGNIQQQSAVTAATTSDQTTTTNQSTTPTQTSEPAQTAETQSQHYTVELSGAALAKSLKLAGQNPSQIALKMGLNIKTVDSYLGISMQTSTPTAPSTSTAVPAANQTTTTPGVTAQAATSQQYSPLEESKESAAVKAAETAQGKK